MATLEIYCLYIRVSIRPIVKTWNLGCSVGCWREGTSPLQCHFDICKRKLNNNVQIGVFMNMN